MCGITGAIWSDPGQAIDRATLERMTESLHHRGPDDVGHYESEFCLQTPYETLPGVALGFRRLSSFSPLSSGVTCGDRPGCSSRCR